MPREDRDIANEAIVRAAEMAFRANEGLKRLLPKAIGESDNESPMTENDIKRLMGR
jgi:hypothetical protein|tara:strand:+ start:339 stop:506 length:168 start_codon:yes stop_codon:yes gene_type:complete